MSTLSPGGSSRKLAWIRKQNVEGWGCSECAWVFQPTGPPIGKSLSEMKQNFRIQLSQEFASHLCDKPARDKEKKPFS
jgi:hypothetical protein